ncbi:hypothetical protein C8J57DRAFT_1593224, partial [Mycena rebaudengoi]
MRLLNALRSSSRRNMQRRRSLRLPIPLVPQILLIIRIRITPMVVPGRRLALSLSVYGYQDCDWRRVSSWGGRAHRGTVPPEIPRAPVDKEDPRQSDDTLMQPRTPFTGASSNSQRYSPQPSLASDSDSFATHSNNQQHVDYGAYDVEQQSLISSMPPSPISHQYGGVHYSNLSTIDMHGNGSPASPSPASLSPNPSGCYADLPDSRHDHLPPRLVG